MLTFEFKHSPIFFDWMLSWVVSRMVDLVYKALHTFTHTHHSRSENRLSIEGRRGHQFNKSRPCEDFSPSPTVCSRQHQ